MSRRFALKLLFYTLAVLYILGDLHVWHGFLARSIDRRMQRAALNQGDDSKILFYVYGRPFTQNQVNRVKQEIAFLRGISPADNGRWSREQDASLEAAARLRIIHAELLRVKARYSDMSLPPRRDEANLEMDRLASRLGEGNHSMAARLERQQFHLDGYLNKIEARLKQTAYLETKIKDAIPVPDAELKNYYEQVREDLTIPKRRQLRHIFLATLDKDAGAVREEAGKLLERLKGGEDFAELARNNSEDEASSPKGGDLGLVTEARPLLPDIDLFALPSDAPVLKQSKLGWHIFLAGEIQPARTPAYDEVKPQLQAALESLRRDRAVSIYSDQSIRDARARQRVWNP